MNRTFRIVVGVGRGSPRQLAHSFALHFLRLNYGSEAAREEAFQPLLRRLKTGRRFKALVRARIDVMCQLLP
jgi:hypothetical protein